MAFEVSLNMLTASWSQSCLVFELAIDILRDGAPCDGDNGVALAFGEAGSGPDDGFFEFSNGFTIAITEAATMRAASAKSHNQGLLIAALFQFGLLYKVSAFG